MYTNMVDLNKKFTQSSFSIFVMEEPCCFVFEKRGKNILQDGKSFSGLRREDTLAKLLFKELKDKTYSDPKTVQSARILERNVRFKLIVNSFDLCNTNYLMQIINN